MNIRQVVGAVVNQPYFAVILAFLAFLRSTLYESLYDIFMVIVIAIMLHFRNIVYPTGGNTTDILVHHEMHSSEGNQVWTNESTFLNPANNAETWNFFKEKRERHLQIEEDLYKFCGKIIFRQQNSRANALGSGFLVIHEKNVSDDDEEKETEIYVMTAAHVLEHFSTSAECFNAPFHDSAKLILELELDLDRSVQVHLQDFAYFNAYLDIAIVRIKKFVYHKSNILATDFEKVQKKESQTSNDQRCLNLELHFDSDCVINIYVPYLMEKTSATFHAFIVGYPDLRAAWPDNLAPRMNDLKKRAWNEERNMKKFGSSGLIDNACGVRVSHRLFTEIGFSGSAIVDLEKYQICGIHQSSGSDNYGKNVSAIRIAFDNWVGGPQGRKY